MGCRGCLVFLVIVFLILAGLTGGAYYLVTQTSSLVVDLPAITPAKDSASSFDNKLSRFMGDVQSRSPFDDSSIVLLEITEAEATAKLAEALSSGQLPIGMANPQVHFRNQRLQASADLPAAVITVNVALQAKVEVQEGKPNVAIERVDIGRYGVPDFMKEIILNAIAAGADSAPLQNLSFDLDGVAMDDGKLTVKGIKPPR